MLSLAFTLGPGRSVIFRPILHFSWENQTTKCRNLTSCANVEFINFVVRDGHAGSLLYPAWRAMNFCNQLLPQTTAPAPAEGSFFERLGGIDGELEQTGSSSGF